MSTLRPASHAGSWFSANKDVLSKNIAQWLAQGRKEGVPMCRFGVGPHAGYTYCGAVLGTTYGHIDTSVERIFVMGPSHVEYFRGFRTTSFGSFETPLGELQVDRETTSSFQCNGVKLLSIDSDIKEHAIEMHLPFIATICPGAKVVPLVFCSMRDSDRELAYELLSPFFNDSKTAFVVSSDFCHWGSRFEFTSYSPIDTGDVTDFDSFRPLTSRTKIQRPIWKSIQELDAAAMQIANKGDAQLWKEYIRKTGNTICGQEPLYILLSLAESQGHPLKFEWLAYDQSSKVIKYSDSSVSYAAGIAN